MVERDPVEQVVKGVQDPDAFGEACAVFGDEGALARLRIFRRDLAGHLSWIGQGQRDYELLREMAHRTAGRAGLLGFPALADASAHLDEAIRRNTGVTAALDRWAEQAQLVAEVAQGGTDSIASDTKDIPPFR